MLQSARNIVVGPRIENQDPDLLGLVSGMYWYCASPVRSMGCLGISLRRLLDHDNFDGSIVKILVTMGERVMINQAFGRIDRSCVLKS